MGSISEPSNAARGSVYLDISYSGCPGNPANGQNSGFSISGSVSFARANVTASGGYNANFGGNFGPGSTFNVESSCTTFYITLYY